MLQLVMWTVDGGASIVAAAMLFVTMTYVAQLPLALHRRDAFIPFDCALIINQHLYTQKMHIQNQHNIFQVSCICYWFIAWFSISSITCMLSNNSNVQLSSMSLAYWGLSSEFIRKQEGYNMCDCKIEKLIGCHRASIIWMRTNVT